MTKKGLLKSLGNILFILSVASAVLFSACLGEKEELRGGFTEEQVKELAEQETISVNDEKITNQEVKAAYDGMPEDLRANITQDDVLVSLINEKLLLQAAEAEGLIPSGVELSAQEKQEATAKLLEENADLSGVQVSDSEIDAVLRAEFSGEALAEDPEIEAFLREKAEEKLLSEKKQERIEEYLRRLQEDAGIQ